MPNPAPGLLLALLAASVAAQRTLHTFDGDAAFDNLGSTVDGVGDVNGDGFADLVVAAPGPSSSVGYARVFSGRDGVLLHELRGSPAEVLFAAAVAGAGDVDGDGCGDVIVGIPGRPRTTDPGTVRVFSGKDAAVLHTFASTDARFGIAVDGAGDTDGDGYADLLVGTSYSNMASLYSGRDGAILYTFVGDSTSDRFSAAVAAVGDVDGDGFDDVAVGAPDGGPLVSGYVRVFSGADGSTLHTWFGDAAGDQLGTSIDAAGDVDGDGCDDVIIGARANINDGYARLFSGRDGSTLRTFAGSHYQNGFGAAVAGPGDVDGDGVPDLVIAAPSEPFSSGTEAFGRARLFSGSDGRLLAMWEGEDTFARLGASVAAAGDVDCDGLADVIIGVPGADSNADQAGRAIVAAFRVPTAGHVRTLTLNGQSSNESFASSVAIVGDVNADGCDDLLVGAPDAGSVLVHSGRATLFSGKDGSVLRTVTGSAAGHHLGTIVAPAGDVDADGTDDYLIGAPGTGTNGLVQVISGASGSVLHSFSGSASTDGRFGNAAAAAGDVDGDGFGDVVIGSPEASPNGFRSGSVWVFSGRNGSLLRRWDGAFQNNLGDQLGFAVAGAGDADGDGLDDVVVGAPQMGLPPFFLAPGYVKVYSVATGQVIRSQGGGAPGDQCGYSVAGLGDVDGDGLDDVAAGIPFWSTLALDDGGKVDLLLAGGVRSIWGRQARESFGSAVRAIGDVDGDGRGDLIVANSASLFANGRVTIHSGASLLPLQDFDDADPTTSFGRAISGSGDVNGDGVRDLLVGSPAADGAAVDSGIAQLFVSNVPKLATVKTFGAGCPGSNGTLPRIGLDGPPPAIGDSYTVSLRAALPSAPCALHIDVVRSDLDLSLIGFSGCRLLVLPFLAVNTTTDAVGRASRTLGVPNRPAYVGVPFHYQWVVLDFAAARVALSDGATIRPGDR